MEIKLGKEVAILGGTYAGHRAWIKPSKTVVTKAAQKVTLIIEITDEDGETDLHIVPISRTHFKFVEKLTTQETFFLGNPAVVKTMRDAARKVAQSNMLSLENYQGIGQLFENMVAEKLRQRTIITTTNMSLSLTLLLLSYRRSFKMELLFTISNHLLFTNNFVQIDLSLFTTFYAL